MALFLGLGWFFLIETVRRLITYIPPWNKKLRYLFLGPEGDEPPASQVSNPRAVLLSKILSFIILLGWIGMTIFIFARMNVPLVELLNLR